MPNDSCKEKSKKKKCTKGGTESQKGKQWLARKGVGQKQYNKNSKRKAQRKRRREEGANAKSLVYGWVLTIASLAPKFITKVGGLF